MSSDFLNPDAHIQKHGDKLPHWQQEEVMQFVTFRLGDALPAARVRQWLEQRRFWIEDHPKPWSVETEGEYHRRFTWKIESWLDQGSGSCLLKEPAAREILSGSLRRFQGERVEHQA